MSVPTSSSSVMKYRSWVPFLRVYCYIRSVALNSGEYGSSSLGTLKEFSDRITTIKQLTGDEAQEIFLKF